MILTLASSPRRYEALFEAAISTAFNLLPVSTTISNPYSVNGNINSDITVIPVITTAMVLPLMAIDREVEVE